MGSDVLDSRLGVINDLLVKVNIPNLVPRRLRFADPDAAFPTVLAVEAWRWFPFHAVSAGGLSAILQELYDAA